MSAATSWSRERIVSLERDITLLARIPLFSELSTEQLRLLAFSAVRQNLSPGQVLFREGTMAGSGYVVVYGALELSVGHGGRREVLTTCEQGSLVGELALFVETKRPATATAVVTSEVLDIDRKLVTRMLNEYPHVATRLRRILAGRLTATIGELRQIQAVLDSVEARA
jgi:CRP-like cAMP-binding protein